MMDVAGQGDRTVVWLGLPAERKATLHVMKDVMNEVAMEQAQLRPRVVFVDTIPVLSPGGVYSEVITTPDGRSVDTRAADGVHLSQAGADVLAPTLLASDLLGEVAGDDDLLHEPDRDQPERQARLHPPRITSLAQLREELGGADDRAGDEVREERQVDGEVEEGRRVQLLPVDVDHVAERLEGEERDADREHHVRDRRFPVDADRLEHATGGLAEETGVLEPRQRAEVGDHRGRLSTGSGRPRGRTDRCGRRRTGWRGPSRPAGTSSASPRRRRRRSWRRS
jgi:hypothetical protein